MTTRNIEIINEVGLHAKPASYFVQIATCFRNCSIWIETADKRLNAKSSMCVLSLGISKGDLVTILADGENEEVAVDVLVSVILSNFDEKLVRELYEKYSKMS